ncbi:MAG: TVP38/TMEM64 family protein [Peptostreptococcaceae bacterium]
MKKDKSKAIKYFVSTLLILMIVIVIYKVYSLDIGIDDIKGYIDSYGRMGPVVYIIMFSLVPLTLFPDSLLAISGGLAFGFINGYIYTTIGALIGGSISFYISRKLGRDAVKKITKEKLDYIEQIINERGFFIIFLLRLIPLFPFDVISYGAGLTSITYKDFILATLIGTIPGIAVFTNIGAQAVNLGSSSFYISIASLLALFAVSFFLKNRYFRKERK